MACSTIRLHSPSLSRAFLPFFSRHINFSPISSRLNRFTSTSRFPSSANSTRPLSPPIHAQGKRSFSVKDEELASADDLRFEAPLKIAEYPDPILRAKNKRIGTFDENLKKLVDEMFDVMYKTDGIGLSAPQVGFNVQLMVFNPALEPSEGEEIVLVNPRVTKYSKKLVLFDEGCLSFPEIYADVERPDSVKVDARDITGAKFSFTLSGLPARVFQHEFDHLQGIVFFDRMTDEVLETIKEKLEALEKKYEEKTGLPSPEKIERRKQKKVAAGFGKS